MRDDQIVAQWRDAKDRRAQVRILAELNDVPKSIIEDILASNGCEIVKKKRSKDSGEGKIWTAEDDARVLVLLGEGKSHEEIADELDRTFMAVRARVTLLKRKEKENKMNGRGWTSDEVAFMLERRKQGVDVRHIAAEMGRTVPAINTKLKKLREEGKKIAAEIEEEERAEKDKEKPILPGPPPDDVAMKAERIAERIIRLAEEYKKAAVFVGEAMDVYIDATADSATLFTKSGAKAIMLKEVSA